MPPTQRADAGHLAQPWTLRRSIQAPPKTHTRPAAHHKSSGACTAHPCSQLKAHKPTHTAVRPRAGNMPNPLRRPHSQLAADIITSARQAKGCGETANKAGNSNANKTKAVMMRCLSISFAASDGHDVLLFGRDQFIHICDVLVGDFLNLCL